MIKANALPPIGRDEQQEYLIRILRMFVRLKLGAIALLAANFILSTPENWARGILHLVSLGTTLIAIVLIKAEKLQWAALLLLADSWGLLTLAALTRGGIADPILIGYVLMIFGAAILMGKWGAFVLTSLSIAATFAMLKVDTGHFLAPLQQVNNPMATWRVLVIFYVLTAFLVYFSIRRLRAILAEISCKSEELEQRNQDLEKEIALVTQMEASLRASEEHLSKVIANAPIAIFALDETGMIAPPKTDFVTGMSLITSNQVVVQSIIESYRDMPFILDNARRALAGEPVKYELFINDHFYEIRYASIQGKAHGSPKLIGVATDITDRILAEEALKRALSERDTLLELNRAITGQLILDKLLDQILESVKQHVQGTQRSSLYLMDEEEGVLVERKSKDWSDHLTPLAIRPIRDILERVYNTGISYVSDPHDSDRYRVITNFPQVDMIKSMVAVPLSFNSKPIGVLCAYNDIRLDAFNADSERFMISLAAPAAAAIEAARLHGETAEARDNAKEQAIRIIQARESESRRIALDLHDHLGQWLSALKLELTRIHKKVAARDPQLLIELDDMMGFTDKFLNEVRSLSLELRPTPLDTSGLEDVLKEYVARHQERMDIPIDLRVSGLEKNHRLPTAIETTIFRAIQEQLSNIARYAKAASVEIVVSVDDDKAFVKVEDNGIGFNVPPSLDFPESSPGGNGLSGMRERVKLVGGKWDIRSETGKGTCIQFTIPLLEERMS